MKVESGKDGLGEGQAQAAKYDLAKGNDTTTSRRVVRGRQLRTSGMNSEEVPERTAMNEEIETDTGERMPPWVATVVTEIAKSNRPEKTLGSSIYQVLNFMGGVSGLLALVGIVFWGGGLVEKVRSLDGRVAAIENGGSQTFRTHASADEKLFNAFDARLKLVEDATRAIHTVDKTVAEITVKLDNLKDQLGRHEAVTGTK